MYFSTTYKYNFDVIMKDFPNDKINMKYTCVI